MCDGGPPCAMRASRLSLFEHWSRASALAHDALTEK
jgi:hypothetical protein